MDKNLGAIASDNEGGNLGVSTDNLKRKQAEKEAVKQCEGESRKNARSLCRMKISVFQLPGLMAAELSPLLAAPLLKIQVRTYWQTARKRTVAANAA